MKRLAVLGVLAAVACGGGDGATDPTADPADVEGTWSYGAEFRDGGCTVEGDLHITQDGGTLSGQLDVTSITCGSQEGQNNPSDAVSGSAFGDSITFTALSFEHRGEVISGQSMQGETGEGRLEVVTRVSVETLSGPADWHATR